MQCRKNSFSHGWHLTRQDIQCCFIRIFMLFKLKQRPQTLRKIPGQLRWLRALYIGSLAGSRNRRWDLRCSHLSRFGRQLRRRGVAANRAEESRRERGALRLSAAILDADEPPGNQFKWKCKTSAYEQSLPTFALPLRMRCECAHRSLFFLLCVSLQLWLLFSYGALKLDSKGDYTFLWS